LDIEDFIASSMTDTATSIGHGSSLGPLPFFHLPLPAVERK
jgi:hypothetical protein